MAHDQPLNGCLQCNINSRLARPTWTGHLAPQLQSLYVAAFAPPPPTARQRGAAAQREASVEPPSVEHATREAPAEDGPPLHDGEQDPLIPGEVTQQRSPLARGGCITL
jgi:hypothetical protein